MGPLKREEEKRLLWSFPTMLTLMVEEGDYGSGVWVREDAIEKRDKKMVICAGKLICERR